MECFDGLDSPRNIFCLEIIVKCHRSRVFERMDFGSHHRLQEGDGLGDVGEHRGIHGIDIATLHIAKTYTHHRSNTGQTGGRGLFGYDSRRYSIFLGVRERKDNAEDYSDATPPVECLAVLPKLLDNSLEIEFPFGSHRFNYFRMLAIEATMVASDADAVATDMVCWMFQLLCSFIGIMSSQPGSTACVLLRRARFT